MAHSHKAKGRRALLRVRPWWPVVVAALTATASVYAWPFLVDDAFIVARYAARIAAGASYTFNDGPRTDGVTGPLWLVPMLLATALDVSPLQVAKLVGLLGSVAACVLVLRRASARSLGSVTSPFITAFLASSAPLLVWAVAGLETGAACFFTTWMLLSATGSRALTLGLSATALLWLRPELASLVLLSLTVVAIRRPRAALVPGLLVLISAAGLFSFRHYNFGHLLPMSAHAKPPELAHGVRYVWQTLRTPAAASCLPALFVAVLWGRREDRTLSVALVVHACSVALAGGDWMASARLFVPVVPIACFVAAQGLARLGLKRRRAALALFVAMCALRFLGALHELPRARAAGQLREARVPALLGALSGVREPIAILDIGAVGYYGGQRLLDLGGLTEPHVAYRPGGHLSKRIDAAWLRRQAPGAIVLHSASRPRVDAQQRLRWLAGYPVERHVSSMPWVVAHYRVKTVIEYTSAYFYVVLVPASQN